MSDIFFLQHAGPALGLLEISSIARGMVVTDALVKHAPITILQAHPITPGKYIVLITGGEAEVAQSMARGLEVCADALIDQLHLPQVDPQVVPAISGKIRIIDPHQIDALGIVETFTVAAAILAADSAIKVSQTTLVQLRLAKGIGGRAFFVLTGELSQIEAAIAESRAIIKNDLLFTTEIIARPHIEMLENFCSGAVF